MKKFAPALAVFGVILIGLVVFSLSRGTAQAPEREEMQATTSESAASSTGAAGASPLVPAASTVKKIVKVYANPSWDIRLRYDPEWTLRQSDDVITISSVSADFMVSKEKPISKPALLESKETTRVILGDTVEVTRFENPKDSYAFYEFFKLRVNKSDYYFRITSVIDPNPKVEEFVKNISLK